MESGAKTVATFSGAHFCNKNKRMEDIEQFASGSGIPIKGMYGPDDVKDVDYDRDIGLAGEPPFTRGVYSTMY